jgi:acyl-CoA synthetase (AMP-forming)/AMP-acid ligase II
MYGSMELAVDVTYNWVDPETKSTTLGHAIDTCSMTIVDRDSRELSPFGGIGEICVAGGHLADGYVSWI